jgi:inner membrane protein
MASVGHIAAGMAAARIARPGRVPRVPAMALWSALSLLPDADVIGFAFGVRYAAPWGHRGATHSLIFALALGLAIGLAAWVVKRPALRTGLIASAVLASHAILDTMTDGGLGCALLWPFDGARYFARWRPIPVAPIGVRFFSSSGASVALIELVLFCPLVLFALWPRRPAPVSKGE